MTRTRQAINLPSWLETPNWFRQQQDSAENYQQFSSTKLRRIPYQDWFEFQEDFVLDESSNKPLTYSIGSALDDMESIQIVHAGNMTIYESVPQSLKDKGLIVMDLFDAMSQHEDLVKEYMNNVIPPESDQIAAYNYSRLNGGIFIYVPANLIINQPIEVTWIQDSRDKIAFNKKMVVVSGDNSQCTIVERLETQGNCYNILTLSQELIVQSGSQIHYVAYDRLNASTKAYIRRAAQVERDATINWSIVEMNEGNTVLDLQTDLLGNGSQSECSTIAIGDGDQLMGIDAKINNIGMNSVGHIAQRGVVLDEATLSFNGIGHILKMAKQADSQQESRILMLSSGARGDANPILLIDEFEVQAGHAASVGRVDEEQLYYLMSRGLSRKEAERLVTRGFLGDVLAQLKDKVLRQEMSACLDYKLRHF